MNKWHDWEYDYMTADQNYLVHVSQNASDHRYFVGTFTGRFKETLYFRDQFDHEFSLNIRDYIFDGGCNISFIPIKEINDWAYDKVPEKKVSQNDDKEETLIGTINSVKREDETNTLACNIQTVNNTTFTCKKFSAYADDIIGNFMTGDKVKVKVRRYKNDSDDRPMLLSIELD